MKMRVDYVTNSSSSSFILGFNTEEEIQNVANQLPSYWAKYVIDNVVSDIENGITSKEDAIESYKDSIYTCGWKFRGKDYWHMSKEERESVEYHEFIKNMLDEDCDELRDELNKYQIISIVGYEDSYDLGSELEHEIMPYLENTIYRISHH